MILISEPDDIFKNIRGALVDEKLQMYVNLLKTRVCHALHKNTVANLTSHLGSSSG